MTAKRFSVECDDADIWEDNHFLAVAYDHHNAKKITERLNKLVDENEQLKQRMDDVLTELYCKDRKLEELGIDIECCDKKGGVE